MALMLRVPATPGELVKWAKLDYHRYLMWGLYVCVVSQAQSSAHATSIELREDLPRAPSCAPLVHMAGSSGRRFQDKWCMGSVGLRAADQEIVGSHGIRLAAGARPLTAWHR